MDIVVERETCAALPEYCSGGFLEHKDGRLMLRMADEFEKRENDWQVTRSWRAVASGAGELYRVQ